VYKTLRNMLCQWDFKSKWSTTPTLRAILENKPSKGLIISPIPGKYKPSLLLNQTITESLWWLSTEEFTWMCLFLLSKILIGWSISDNIPPSLFLTAMANSQRYLCSFILISDSHLSSTTIQRQILKRCGYLLTRTTLSSQNPIKSYSKIGLMSTSYS